MALAVTVILAGTGGKAPEIGIKGRGMGLPQGAPPKLTEALLVQVSGICHPLLTPAPLPVVSCLSSLTHRPVQPSQVTPGCGALIRIIPLQPAEDFHIHSLVLFSQRSVEQAEQPFFLSLLVLREHGWVLGEMVHFTCFYLKVTQLVGGARSCIPTLATPQPVLSLLTLPPRLLEGPGAGWEKVEQGRYGRSREGACPEPRDRQRAGRATIICCFVTGQALFSPLSHITSFILQITI